MHERGCALLLQVFEKLVRLLLLYAFRILDKRWVARRGKLQLLIPAKRVR